MKNNIGKDIEKNFGPKQNAKDKARQNAKARIHLALLMLFCMVLPGWGLHKTESLGARPSESNTLKTRQTEIESLEARSVKTDSLEVDQEEADSLESDSVSADSLTADSQLADSVRALPWPESLQYNLSRLLESKIFETSQVGLMVWDLDADSCLYAYRERQLMRPASTMKLLTAITALDKLGGSYQFKTQLKYTGKINEGVLEGDIYCIGGMDPRFNNDDMTAFVSTLRDMGVDSIRGSVYADRSMKDADLLGEGWCWDDDNPVLSPLVFGRKDTFMPRFIQRLQESGIYLLHGDTTEMKRCPQSAFSICTRFHTMDQIMHKMMKESDNLYAESMYYQIAASTGNRPASAKSAKGVERKLIGKLGLDSKRYRLADGSGLSLYNYLSAELECKLLRYAYNDENIMPHLNASLPIAGTDGTLKKRMRGTAAEGNVKAKTGTLEGVISLAGYCTAANGHHLCFSIINNGIMHAGNARRFQDQVCIAMCQP